MLSAALATAVAVPATWYVATRDAATAAAERPAAVSGPADQDELRAQLLAQLPEPDATDAVLLELSLTGEVATGLPPGRYRLQLICGRLRVQAEVEAIRVRFRTPRELWAVELPCPSTPVSPDEEFDFTGLPAGAVAASLETVDAAPIGLLLLARFVPVAGGAGGTGG